MRSWLLLSVSGAALLALAACTERVVTAVRVASVEVSPGESTVQVGAVVRLSARVRDGDGHELSGRRIQWSISPAGPATVEDGLVHGVAPGSVTVTATAEGVRGSSSVDVTGVPLSADPDSLAFAGTASASAPAPARVTVSSTGADPGAVAAWVDYPSGSSRGWLKLSSSGATLPVEVTVTAAVAALASGTYRAAVRIWAPAAADTVRVPVTLRLAPAPPPPPPSAPSGVQAVAADTGRVDVTWVDESDDEAEFRVERSGGDAGAPWTPIASVAANVTSYADTAVSPGSTYWYRVQACSSAGCSGYSAADSATTPAPPPLPPAKPTGLVATATSPARVDVAWQDNSPDEAEFRLERSGGPGGAAWASLAVLPADSTRYTDTTVVPATRFYYRVRACSSAGCSAFSAPDTVDTPAAPPAAPSELDAAAVDTGRIDVSWQDNSSDETEFRLERSGGAAGTAWAELAALPADSTAYVDTAVAAATGYYYRVRACSAAGCSPYSATDSATTPAPPPPPPPPTAPSALTAAAVSSTRIDLAWKDNSADETGFRLERSGGAAGSGWKQIATPAANSTAYTDATVSATTTYYYRLRACSAAGCSAYTATASATTPAPPPPEIALGSSSAALSAVVGDSSDTRTVSVDNEGGGALTGLTASTSYAAGTQAWLRATLAAAAAPTQLRLRGSAARLLAGTYHATVTVESGVAANSPQTVDVTLDVDPNPDPWIWLDSTSVTYSGIFGGPDPGARTVGVRNGGMGSLTGLRVAVSYPPGAPAGWLEAALASPTAPTSLTVYASLWDEDGHLLPPGTYSAAVVISSPVAANDPQTLSVTLTVR